MLLLGHLFLAYLRIYRGGVLRTDEGLTLKISNPLGTKGISKLVHVS